MFFKSRDVIVIIVIIIFKCVLRDWMNDLQLLYEWHYTSCNNCINDIIPPVTLCQMSSWYVSARWSTSLASQAGSGWWASSVSLLSLYCHWWMSLSTKQHKDGTRVVLYNTVATRTVFVALTISSCVSVLISSPQGFQSASNKRNF